MWHFFAVSDSAQWLDVAVAGGDSEISERLLEIYHG